ncbi:hypothetical protein ATPR_1620 [Acetobacter tropicalis NBRC 101654]|nr:hypothetical protein ATPR_1620 [Acetobacter tropicalis NBRC 101654]
MEQDVFERVFKFCFLSAACAYGAGFRVEISVPVKALAKV